MRKTAWYFAAEELRCLVSIHSIWTKQRLHLKVCTSLLWCAWVLITIVRTLSSAIIWQGRHWRFVFASSLPPRPITSSGRSKIVVPGHRLVLEIILSVITSCSNPWHNRRISLGIHEPFSHDAKDTPCDWRSVCFCTLSIGIWGCLPWQWICKIVCHIAIFELRRAFLYLESR
jgi:hypothetical protein